MPKPDKWEKYAQPEQSTPAAGDKWAKYADKSQDEQQTSPPGNPGVAQSVSAATTPFREFSPSQVVGEIGKGALKGVLQTTTGVSNLLNKIPVIGEYLAPEEGINAMENIAEAKNVWQQTGKTGEQVGEWLIPTGASAKAGTLATKIPKIGKVAGPAARVAAEAAETGLRNKLQGGDFETGAVAGGIGAAIPPVAEAAAKGLANVAAAPGKRLLKSIPESVDIGETILTKTRGIRPSTITRELQDQVTGVSGKLDEAVQAADAAGKTVSLAPAREVAEKELKTAIEKNSPNYIRDVEKVGNQLKMQYGPGGKPVEVPTIKMSEQATGLVDEAGNAITRPMEVAGKPEAATIPDFVSPSKARSIKQGIDLDINTWNPEAAANIGPLQERVYGAINTPFHEAVPAAAALDKELTSLIPAREAIWNVSFNPNVTRNIFEKFQRPTGALVGAGFGASQGYEKGGTTGALIGGVGGGLLGPALIGSPTGQMSMARMLQLTPKAIPVIKGVGLQADRP